MSKEFYNSRKLESDAQREIETGIHEWETERNLSHEQAVSEEGIFGDDDGFASGSDLQEKREETVVVDTLSRLRAMTDSLSQIVQITQESLQTFSSPEEAEEVARAYLSKHTALCALLEYFLHKRDVGFEKIHMEDLTPDVAKSEYFQVDPEDDERGSYTYKEGTYVYDTERGGIPYRFILTAKNCLYDNPEEKDEHFCRIDFHVLVPNGEFVDTITNVGLQEIHAIKPYIRDFYRFLRMLNGADEIEVEASKTSVDLALVEDEKRFSAYMDQMQKKIVDASVETLEQADLSWEDDECIIMCEADMIDDGTVSVQWENGGKRELYDKKGFLYKLLQKAYAGDMFQRLEIIELLETTIADNRKEQQRLKLYKRMLDRIGFSTIDILDKQGELSFLYAKPTEKLERELFPDVKSPSVDATRVVIAAMERLGLKDVNHHDLLEAIIEGASREREESN